MCGLPLYRAQISTSTHVIFVIYTLILAQAVKMTCRTHSTDNSLGLITLYFLTSSMCFHFSRCSGSSCLASDTHRHTHTPPDYGCSGLGPSPSGILSCPHVTHFQPEPPGCPPHGDGLAVGTSSRLNDLHLWPFR